MHCSNWHLYSITSAMDAVEIFQRDLLSGLADQARTKVSTA
jgi:hypothetical protein